MALASAMFHDHAQMEQEAQFTPGSTDENSASHGWGTPPGEDETVIPLTRLNGNTFVVNPDLLERAESTPDTVVTLVDGSRIVVLESIEALTELIVVFRARVAARAHVLLDETGSPLLDSDAEVIAQGARVVPIHLREA